MNALGVALWWGLSLASAQELVPTLEQGVAAAAGGDEVSTSVRLVVMLTAIGFLPGLLMVMTPFTRFIVVFSLLRQALGLQQSPPNQVLIGLSVVLAMVVMQPTLDQVNVDAVQPYMAGELDTGDAYRAAIDPMRQFMLSHTTRDDLGAAMRVSRLARPDSLADVPTSVVVTGYVLSELRAAFSIAVKVYVPFLVVDLIVASVLLGMGMMMLPPGVVALPFKLLLFVLMDGWSLLVTGLVRSVG